MLWWQISSRSIQARSTCHQRRFLSRKQGTLSDRVDTGSAVNFHLPTSEPITPKSSTLTASKALVTDLVEIYPAMLHMSLDNCFIDKHDTLSDRVDPGSAVHFHLPTSLPKTDHPEIFEFHSRSRLVSRSRRDLSNHAPHVAGDVLDLVDNFDPRFPCSVPAQKLALSCRGSDNPVPGKASFPPYSDTALARAQIATSS